MAPGAAMKRAKKRGRPYRWPTKVEHMKMIRDVRKAWEDELEKKGEARTAWRDGKYPTAWAAARLLQKVNPEYRMVGRKNLARILNRHFTRGIPT
jgi:hypothetical protein